MFRVPFSDLLKAIHGHENASRYMNNVEKLSQELQSKTKYSNLKHFVPMVYDENLTPSTYIYDGVNSHNHSRRERAIVVIEDPKSIEDCNMILQDIGNKYFMSAKGLKCGVYSFSYSYKVPSETPCTAFFNFERLGELIQFLELQNVFHPEPLRDDPNKEDKRLKQIETYKTIFDMVQPIIDVFFAQGYPYGSSVYVKGVDARIGFHFVNLFLSVVVPCEAGCWPMGSDAKKDFIQKMYEFHQWNLYSLFLKPAERTFVCIDDGSIAVDLKPRIETKTPNMVLNAHEYVMIVSQCACILQSCLIQCDPTHEIVFLSYFEKRLLSSVKPSNRSKKGSRK